MLSCLLLLAPQSGLLCAQLRDGVVECLMSAANRDLLLRLRDSGGGSGAGSANGSLATALCLPEQASTSPAAMESWDLQKQLRWMREERRKLAHARATDEQVEKLLSMGYGIDWQRLSS